MSGRDWDGELKKIDKRMETVSDEALLPSKAAKSPAERAQVENVQQATSTLGVFARLALAIALGVGIVFWPYPARCGPWMVAYLGAVATLVTAGVWSSIWTWRHRAAKGHTLSLLLILWGLVLGAVDVLPRIGYAKPGAGHPAYWICP
ncbi:MAG: hypothetical protein ACHQQR_10745 [Gemmatimonadales bacterium]|jgi:hypothetical protein